MPVINATFDAIPGDPYLLSCQHTGPCGICRGANPIAAFTVATVCGSSHHAAGAIGASGGKETNMKRCAIIDDYQECALDMADWASLGDEVEVTTFKEHWADEDEVASRLAEFEIVCIMRERTPFPGSLIAKLPKLELLLTSGMRNFSIDTAAAKDHGVTVCGTPSLGYLTAELTWGLILGLVRHIPLEDRSTRLGSWQRTVGYGLRGKTLDGEGDDPISNVAGQGRRHHLHSFPEPFGVPVPEAAEHVDREDDLPDAQREGAQGDGHVYRLEVFQEIIL